MDEKERLENLSPIGFDGDGNLLVKGEDYHWLLEQVEKVQELKNEIQAILDSPLTDFEELHEAIQDRLNQY